MEAKMNRLLNDIKELPEFYKVLAILLAVISYIFVPPLFADDYFSGMVVWIDFAFWGFLSAIFLGCWIGKCAEESEDE